MRPDMRFLSWLLVVFHIVYLWVISVGHRHVPHRMFNVARLINYHITRRWLVVLGHVVAIPCRHVVSIVASLVDILFC